MDGTLSEAIERGMRLPSVLGDASRHVKRSGYIAGPRKTLMTACLADITVREMNCEGDAIILPKGYTARPLYPLDGDVPLTICVIVGATSGAGGAFFRLRETIDATIYLGCLTDRGGDAKAWLEIWVQNVDGVEESFAARADGLSNSLIDQRWGQCLAMFRKVSRPALIETGWETVHPAPTFYDEEVARLIYPVEETTKRPFRLCTDDAALVAGGLPRYTSSLHRYLWNGPNITTPVFVAATNGAPAPTGVKSLAEAFSGLLPFNPGGGFLLVRSFYPLSLADYSDVLGGKSWAGLSSGGATFDFGGVYSQLEDHDSLVQRGAHIFSGRSGVGGRLREVFHLKLNLVLQLLSQTREAIRSQQMPLLNLSAESFRVRLSQTGTGLPFFWTARVELVESSAGLASPIITSESRYFIPPSVPGNSIYRPETVRALTTGEGVLRIRVILPPVQEGTSIEATLMSDERLEVAGNDLVHIRLGLPIGRIDLYGHADKSEALAKGETRIRTLPQKLSSDVLEALNQATGVPVRTVHFEVLPMLASPCDLYALGVVATRLFLVDSENSLSVALDQLLSLAHEVSTKHSEDRPFAIRLRSVIDEDSRWRLVLGPHRLTSLSDLRDVAPRVIPNDLWWETLGIILRLFPGTGPDSFCRDFGDAPPLALEKIFDQPLAELEVLQARTRSLVVKDWDQNLEIHEAIGAVMAKQDIKPPA
jgi:hypothetical protein